MDFLELAEIAAGGIGLAALFALRRAVFRFAFRRPGVVFAALFVANAAIAGGRGQLDLTGLGILAGLLGACFAVTKWSLSALKRRPGAAAALGITVDESQER